MKIHLQDVKQEPSESPKKKFGLLRRHISHVLQQQDEHNRKPPFDLEHAVLAPGKRNYPHHTHATTWEMYYAISGTAQMRIEDEIHDFQPGDVFLCPPGQAHQLINNSTEGFEFLVIANNPDFDTCYYPDSDKLLLHPRWGAKPKDMERAWTYTKEGLASSYWDREE